MSTDAQPPSREPSIDSLPTVRKPSVFQKLSRQKQPPPAAFETQSIARRAHQRSSSFSGFVRRILPSYHEERGHTLHHHSLRQQYEDDGPHAAVDLVFGVSGARNSNELKGSGNNRNGIVNRTRSCSPHERDCSKPSGARRTLGTIMGAVEAEPRACHQGSETETFRRPLHILSWGGGLLKTKQTQEDGEHPHQRSSELPNAHISSSNIEMSEPENSEITKTQQMYQDKKTRRQQRRSLQESGDFLGVQGANPRTGYWDVSSGTSSSEPSQMSEETKKKLDQEVKDMEEKKRKYEEAQAKHEAELSRVQTLRDNKRQEKEKRKKMELKMKQRRHGKWKLSEQGWSSVAEPELSPIIQSVVGSPTRETAPADRLFPMPCAADPNPYVNPYKTIELQDYFGHRHVSSPLAKERSNAQSAPRTDFISRKPVGSPVRQRSNHSSNTILHTGSPMKDNQSTRGTPQQLQDPDGNSPRIEVVLDASPSQKLDSFLDQLLQVEPGDLQENEATAISYQPVLTSHAKILQLSDQSPLGTSLGKRYTSLKELPPVNLKDPFAARIPLSYQTVMPSVWAPPTIPDSPERQVSHIITPTTTTTGYDRLQPLDIQFDGQSDDTSDPSDAQARRPSLHRKTSRIPLRTSSHQRNKQHIAQSTGLQTNLADIATSSEHLLSQTKERTIRLCHTILPGSEKVVTKSTPISMSTSPQTPQQPGKGSPAAHTAALTAFQNLRHRVAMRKAAGQDREKSLTPPKLRRPETEMRDVSPRAEVVPGGRGDIGNPLTKRGNEASPDLYERRLIAAVKSERPGERRDDSLVVWHPSPSAENVKSKVVANTGEVMELTCVSRRGAASPARKPVVKRRDEILSLKTTHHNRGLSPIRGRSPHRGASGASGQLVGQAKPKPEDLKLVQFKLDKKGGPSNNKRASPKSASPQLAFVHTMSGIALRMLQTAWWIVGPVFDPESDLRKRWESGNSLTWRDRGLFAAAILFMVAVLLVTVRSIRVLLVVVQVVRAVWSVIKVVTEF